MAPASKSSARETLLIVDDDAGIRELLARYLGENGYLVGTVADGREMDEWLSREQPDLVILDLMLPGEDGLSLARRLRERGPVPILMLSARGEDIDRIVGLEVGADDYLTKPFNPRELLARVRAILRRTQSTPLTAATTCFGPYQLDPLRQQLLRGDERIELTPAEFDLMKVLSEHPNRVLSRDFILDALKGGEREPFDRSIDIRVARLRRHIEPEHGRPRFIRTIWGKGYEFTPDGDG